MGGGNPSAQHPNLDVHGCRHWRRAPLLHLAQQSPQHHLTDLSGGGTGRPMRGVPHSLMRPGHPHPEHCPAAMLAGSAPHQCPHPARVFNFRPDLVHMREMF